MQVVRLSFHPLMEDSLHGYDSCIPGLCVKRVVPQRRQTNTNNILEIRKTSKYDV